MVGLNVRMDAINKPQYCVGKTNSYFLLSKRSLTVNNLCTPKQSQKLENYCSFQIREAMSRRTAIYSTSNGTFCTVCTTLSETKKGLKKILFIRNSFGPQHLQTGPHLQFFFANILEESKNLKQAKIPSHSILYFPDILKNLLTLQSNFLFRLFLFSFHCQSINY